MLEIQVTDQPISHVPGRGGVNYDHDWSGE